MNSILSPNTLTEMLVGIFKWISCWFSVIKIFISLISLHLRGALKSSRSEPEGNYQETCYVHTILDILSTVQVTRRIVPQVLKPLRNVKKIRYFEIFQYSRV